MPGDCISNTENKLCCHSIYLLSCKKNAASNFKSYFSNRSTHPTAFLFYFFYLFIFILFSGRLSLETQYKIEFLVPGNGLRKPLKKTLTRCLYLLKAQWNQLILLLLEVISSSFHIYNVYRFERDLEGQFKVFSYLIFSLKTFEFSNFFEILYLLHCIMGSQVNNIL